MSRFFLILLPVAAFAAGWCFGWVPQTAHTGPAAAAPAVPPPPAVDRVAAAVKGGGDLKQLAREWAASDPRSFLQWLVKTRPQPAREVIREFFTAWLKTDPDAAMTAMRDTPPRFGLYDTQESSFYALQLGELLARDPSAALRWLRTEPALPGFTPIMFEVMNGGTRADLSKLDPAGVSKILNTARKGMAATIMAKSFAKHLAAKDIPLALTWANTLSPEHRTSAIGQILQMWSKTDMPAVLEYLASAPSSVRRTQALMVMHDYAREQPRAAIEWIQAHSGTDGFYFFDVWVRRGPEEATAYALQLDNPQTEQTAVSTLMRAMCMNSDTVGGYPGMVAWVNNLPEEHRRHALSSALPIRYDDMTPLLLKDMEARAPDDPYSREVATLIAQNIGRGDDSKWPEIIDWALAHPGTVSNILLEESAQSFQRMGSSHAVNRLLDRIPPGAQREQIERFLRKS